MTAYVLSTGDCSSDVCSSDLNLCSLFCQLPDHLVFHSHFQHSDQFSRPSLIAACFVSRPRTYRPPVYLCHSAPLQPPTSHQPTSLPAPVYLCLATLLPTLACPGLQDRLNKLFYGKLPRFLYAFGSTILPCVSIHRYRVTGLRLVGYPWPPCDSHVCQAGAAAAAEIGRAHV